MTVISQEGAQFSLLTESVVVHCVDKPLWLVRGLRQHPEVDMCPTLSTISPHLIYSMLF